MKLSYLTVTLTWLLSTGAVESRLYAESMTGQTAKSNPKANKIDEKELARLQRQDFWIQMTRLKLLMDLVFVCAYFRPAQSHHLPGPHNGS